MTKQPTRLADFEIPRSEGALPVAVPPAVAAAPLEAPPPLVPVPAPAAVMSKALPDVVPVRISPRPVAEARQAMTIRLPISMHERIRMLMFTSRRSQQDIVEAALDAFLSANQT
jgi:hypothetical protein